MGSKQYYGYCKHCGMIILRDEKDVITFGDPSFSYHRSCYLHHMMNTTHVNRHQAQQNFNSGIYPVMSRNGGK